MSDFDDHLGEMSRHRLITDRDAETILSGVAGDPEFDELVEFVGELRRTAMDHEIGPTAFEVAMSAGFSNENGDLSATAASNVTGPAPQVAGLPNRRTRMPIPAFIAGLTLAGKLTIGASLVAAAGTGAAATGSLPGPVQDAVASAVSTVTPIELPRGGDTADEEEFLATTTDGETTDDETTGGETTGGETTGGETTDGVVAELVGGTEAVDEKADGPDDAAFGADVSAAATGADGSEPGVDGYEISELARQLRFQYACQSPETVNDESAGGTDEASLGSADVNDEETTDGQRPNCRPETAGPPETAVRPETAGPPATTGRPDAAVPATSDLDAQTASDTGRSTSAPASTPAAAPASTPAPAATPPAAPVPAATEVAPATVPAQDPPPQSPPVADPPVVEPSAPAPEAPGRP